MAITWIQNFGKAATSAGTAQATSAAGSSVTPGDYLVGFAWGWNSGSPGQTNATVTFSDNKGGNTWVKPASLFQKQASDLWLQMSYTKVVNGGTGMTVTVTDSSTSGNGVIEVCAAEFTGVAASSPEDGAAVSAQGSSVTAAPGSKNYAAGSLVLSLVVDDNTTYGGSPPAGFTRVANETNGTSFEIGEAAYAIGPTSPGNPSRTITSAKWAAAQFALLASGGAAATAPPPFRRAQRWFRRTSGLILPAAGALVPAARVLQSVPTAFVRRRLVGGWDPRGPDKRGAF